MKILLNAFKNVDAAGESDKGCAGKTYYLLLCTWHFPMPGMH